jgi:hypothetical protein
MKLLIYFYRYGITHPHLLDLLTKENWFSVEVPEDILTAAQGKLDNYFAGDSILVQLEKIEDIEACIRTYQATNYDELIANSIKKGFIEDRVELFNHILCPHKIAAALGAAIVTGIVVIELYPKIGNHHTTINPAPFQSQNVAFFQLSSLLANRGTAYNREAYVMAAGTDVKLIQELHRNFTIDPDDKHALYLNAMIETNGELAKFLITQIPPDDLKNAFSSGDTREFDDAEWSDLLNTAAMTIGDNQLINHTLELTGRDYKVFLSSCTNLEALLQLPIHESQDDNGLCTAAYFARIDLLDFWIGKSDSNADIAELAYGAAAGGHGAILDVTLTVIQKLGFIRRSVLWKLLTLAYCFDNYHCIAIIAKYDQHQELKTRGLMQVPTDLIFGNKYRPSPPPFPAHWASWYDSFYSDDV